MNAQTPVTGTWNVNANGNWSAAGSWAGGVIPGLSTGPTAGVDDVANIIFNISTTRTVTIDAGVPGSQVVLGTLNIGDTTGGSSFNISGGTINFDVSSGSALLDMKNGGGNATISSNIILSDPLDIVVNDVSNNQGVIFQTGVISGGAGAGNTSLTIQDASSAGMNWVILRGNNTFDGQIQVDSGTLRLETSLQAAGLTGVGNETIVNAGGSVDLRNLDLNINNQDDTEIFVINGFGYAGNGNGALRNTSGSATISHVILGSDASYGGYSRTDLTTHTAADGTTTVFPILDLADSEFTKTGAGDFVLHNTTILKGAGGTGVINVREGELRFESNGGSSTNATLLDDLTVNVFYNHNPLDTSTFVGSDPASGSRTSDPFNPNNSLSLISGNTVSEPRLEFYRQEGVTHENYTINLGIGAIQRNGPTSVGQPPINTTLGASGVINLIGGPAGRAIIDSNGGSASYNSGTLAYDEPGALIIQGEIRNTGSFDTGTVTGTNAGEGLTIRGNRTVQIENANANFNGVIIVKQNTGRYLPGGFSTSSGATESQYANLHLSGTDGGLNQASSIVLQRYGSLLLDNSATATNNDRLNDAGTVDMRNGVLHVRSDGVSLSEDVGNVALNGGQSFLYLDPRDNGSGSDGVIDLTINSISSSDGGVLTMLSPNSDGSWGVGAPAAGDVRVALTDAASVTQIGNPTGTTDRAVILNLFGGVVDAPGAASVTRPAWSVENGMTLTGVGAELMTLDGGFLRPLAASEYDTGLTPTAGANWRVLTSVANANTRGETRSLTAPMTINSLTIDHQASTAGQDVVVMDPTTTLTINSGMINFTSFAQQDSANMEAVIRGGTLDLAGQTAVINSSLHWEDTNRNDANYYNYLTGNNAFIRSSMVNADGLIKTGRNNVYLDTVNSFTPGSTAYVTGEGSLVLRNSDALQGISEVVVSGKGNFLLDNGVNISGINLRAGPQDQARTILRSESSRHATWGGDIIIDNADAAGSSDFDVPVITARNNATLSIFGNIYVDPASSNAQTDSDAFNDPFRITTSIGEAGTINLFGQVRDRPSGNIANATDGIAGITRINRAGGDQFASGQADSNHSLGFQMSGHDEMNVNVYQQWDATGRLDATRGYFRILYDPASAVGGTGFYTDAARSLITSNDYWTRFALGADSTSFTSTYNSHVSLTKDGQIFNAPYIYAYNNNRNGTLTLAGENRSGTVYWGSDDNATRFSLQFANQGGERDVRFHQVAGGTMVFNGRLDDENGTAQNFNASATISGPGTVLFNANVGTGLAGASDIDRWNFMAGTAIWEADSMTGNNQFASGSTSTAVGKSTWGGGTLVFQNSGSSARTQTLNSDLYLTNGASRVDTRANTTLTLGSSATSLFRRSGSTLEFIENGGVINLSASSLSTTDGDFLGSWGVYGDGIGVSDWAARQGTTGVQAFAGYTSDTLSTGTHTNFTGAATTPLTADADTATLRFGGTTALDLGGFQLTLEDGGILIPVGSTGAHAISNGTLTSGWTTDGSNDLAIHNFGDTTTIGAVITDNGANRLNLVHSGDGRTVLEGANDYSGDTYLNGGTLSISSADQLGTFSNASIVQVQRANIGSTNGVNASGLALTFTTANAPATGATGTYNSNGSQQVTALTLTDGGSGYSTGVHVTTDRDSSGDAAGDGNAGLWAIFDSGNIHFDGGTLEVTESMTLGGERTLWLGGNGGTLSVSPDKVLTVNGYITSEFSHVTTDNGFSSSNHIGAEYQPASDRNPDIGDLHIAGGGTVELRYDPDNDGAAESNMGLTYGGITYIDEGVLRLRGVGSSGTNALGTHRSFLDGTIIGPNGTLNLSYVSSDPTMYEWITMQGYGYEGMGAINQGWSNLDIRLVRLSGQMFVEGDTLFNIRNDQLRLNENGGNLEGEGDIIRKGNNEFYIYGNSPLWTGDLRNASGNVRLYGSGRLGGTENIVLQRNTYFGIGNGDSSINQFQDRIRDDAVITSNGYVRMRMEGGGITYSGVERVGSVNVEAGNMSLENDGALTLLSGAYSALENNASGFRAGEINRTPGSIVSFRQLDPTPGAGFAESGTGFAGGDFDMTDAASHNKFIMMVDTLPDAVGGDGTAGNHTILPGFFGGTRLDWVGNTGTGTGTTPTFLMSEDRIARNLMVAEAGTDPFTGDATYYLRPLAESEYFTVANPGTDTNSTVSLDAALAGSTDKNVSLVGLTTDSIGGGLTGRRNSIITLDGHQTVNSLSFRSESHALDGNGRGNTTTLTMDECGVLVIASGVIQMSNTGTMDQNGNASNTGDNLDMRSFIQGGRLDFNGREAIISNDSIWAQTNTSTSVPAGGLSNTDGDNAWLTINSVISNTGGNGLTKSGGSSLFLQAPNEYTGPTNVVQGLLYARDSGALGQSTDVYVSGSGGFVVGMGSKIEGVTLHVGTISGNNIGLALEQGSYWGGDVIIDNVDTSSSAGGYVRNFTPRIYANSTALTTIAGDIYGGADVTATGAYGDGSRIFSTYTGGAGILDIRGSIRDSAAGAVGALVDGTNQNQVLRMEVVATNHESNVQLWNPHDSGGRIELKQGVLSYQGTGDFYSAAAALAQNPDNPMSGFHLGGRSVMSGDGGGADNLSFFLQNAGSTFNLASFTVGVDPLDPDNYSGNDNFNRGNTTGNSLIGGNNRSGTVTFGTGTGTLTFTDMTRFAAYDRNLQLFATGEGTVDLALALMDGGDGVNSSITKVGDGTVRLLGSSAGDATVEQVFVNGGTLVATNYDVNANRRFGDGAALGLGGGILAIDNDGVENLGAVSVNAGGSGLGIVGTGAVTVSSLTGNGGSVHIQSIAGGSMTIAGAGARRVGDYATYGASGSSAPFATDWAATDGSGNVVAYTGYGVDSFAAGTHTDVQGAGLAGAATGSLRFDSATGNIGSGAVSLDGGGVLITSNHVGGTPMAAGTSLTTTGATLFVHNFASGDINLDADISGSQKVQFGGTGTTVLGGTNTNTGSVAIVGGATLEIDGLARLGTPSDLQMNNGTLRYTGAPATPEVLSTSITAGAGMSTLELTDAGARLILRGAGNNLLTSEGNPVASLTAPNQFAGGFIFAGEGTFQFGDRSAGNAAQDLLGVVNNYSGLTVIGDGTSATRVDIQGQGNDNAQYTPFGTTYSWADGTIVRNNATVEISPRRGDSTRDNQIRLREWFQWGEAAGDNVTLEMTTHREVVLDGFHNVVGDLTINVNNAGYADSGNTTGQNSVYFGLNEGGLYGSGNIIKQGNGTVQMRDSMPNYTGQIRVEDGNLYGYGQGDIFGTGSEPIVLGVVGGASGLGQTRLAIFAENGTNGSGSVLTYDSPVTHLEVKNDIQIADGTAQDIRLMSGYIPTNGTVTWSGNIDLGAGGTNQMRFYFEDTENVHPDFMGYQQQVVMAVTGDITGTRHILLDTNEGGDQNQTIPGAVASDLERSIIVTYDFSGDNTAWNGNLRIGAETGGTFDKDDAEIARFGSATAIDADNSVQMRNFATMQTGGQSVIIGNLVTEGGNSTSGVYSFTGPSFDAGRQMAVDLDHVVTGNTGTNGKTITIVGDSSEIIENASATPGTLTITQTTDANWDALFRDGVVADGVGENCMLPAAALNLVKAGASRATLTIVNDYSGTTLVTEGNLQVGSGGTGEWEANFVQGSGTFEGAVVTGVQLAGSTGTGVTTVEAGATLSGTGNVRGDLVVNGNLAMGDSGGQDGGTLFVGDTANQRNVTFNAGSTTTFEVIATPHQNSDMVAMTSGYNLTDANYLTTVTRSVILGSLGTTPTALDPTSFGEAGTGISAGAYDHLEISGGLTWNGGTIKVEPDSGWMPAAGQIYNLLDWFDAASTNWGSFTVGGDLLVGNGDDSGDLDLPDLSGFDSAMRWDTRFFLSDGVVFIAAPEPGRVGLLLVAAIAGMGVRRRRRTTP